MSPEILARAISAGYTMVIVPFFVVSLCVGQRPLHVLQVSNDLYNVRFGLIMLVPAAIGIGYLVGTLQRFKPAMYVAGSLVLVLVVGLGASLIRHDNVVTYAAAREPCLQRRYSSRNRSSRSSRRTTPVAWCLWSRSAMRISPFQLPSDQLVYEGSYRQWLPSLQNPSGNHIEWIVARCGHDPSPDKVCLAVGQAQLSHYSVVYTTADHPYRVYQLRK